MSPRLQPTGQWFCDSHGRFPTCFSTTTTVARGDGSQSDAGAQIGVAQLRAFQNRNIGTPFATLRGMTSASFLVSDVSCRAAEHAPSEDCCYRVAWAINPHMQVGAVEVNKAKWQHAAFVHLLRSLGAQVTVLPFVHGAYDSVFAKDNAVVVDERALLARPRHAERMAEQAARRQALEAVGITVTSAPETALEGGDVVVLPDVRGALLGHGFRTERAATDDLASFIDAPVTPIKLVDPRLYHLDMAVTVLSDGTAIVCEDALALGSRSALRRAVRDVVPVSVEDALTFGVNLVQVGRDIVLGGRCPVVMKALEERGYRVHLPPLDQFHLAGGSAACLVARRHVSAPPASRVRAA